VNCVEYVVVSFAFHHIQPNKFFYCVLALIPVNSIVLRMPSARMSSASEASASLLTSYPPGAFSFCLSAFPTGCML
jgi:hypothetical protein